MGQKNLQGNLNIEGSIKEYGQPLLTNLAAPYDNTVTYEVGNLCIYRGILYQCAVEVEQAEDFDSDK